MRSPLLIAACLLVCQGYAQSRLTIGQYSYIRRGEPLYVSPVLQYQDRRNWYLEARYNYEDTRTYSVYGGYTFAAGHDFSYAVTPMAGVMTGRLRGVSTALNAEVDYRKMYFSTQTQYCFSPRDARESFFFSWSEAGYRAFHWLYTGVSLQYTKPYHAGALTEPGAFICVAVKGWTFPMYAFLPSHETPFWVVGLTHEFKYAGKVRSSTNKPSSSKRGKGSMY